MSFSAFKWLGIVLLLVQCCLMLCACDDAPRTGRMVVVPKKKVAHIKAMTQLQPNRPTHVSIDQLGNVIYTVETERGLDGAMIVGESGLPRATTLTSVNILAAMGETETIGGSGAIQDLATGSDGLIYFYFVGGKGRTIRACVGRYDARRQVITILVDTENLMKRSGMGDSIALARGVLLPGAGHRMGLWLRHFDGWAMFHFDIRRIAPYVDPEFVRSYTKVIDEIQELRLSQTRYEFSPGPGSDLFLTDSMTGTLWQVDPTGKATVRALLTGLPADLSLPLATGENQILLFAADAAPIEGEIPEMLRRSIPRATYPALIQLEAAEMTAIDRNDLRAFGGFPVYAMRIHEMKRAPDGSLIAHDQASGQLMRITITTE